ncbi:MAG: electron transfer flavoprotein subunit alpha/FixB family protein [Comamonas sp.]
MTTSRRIAVLLPPAEPGDSFDHLLAAAAVLAQGRSLDVLALRRSDAAPLAAQALPAPVPLAPRRWWDLSHPQLERVDADRLVPLFLQALEVAGIAGPALVLLPQGPLGEECAARLAAHLQGVSLGRCADIALCEGEVRAVRTAYGGRVALQLTSAETHCVATWRPGAAGAAAGPEVQPEAMQALLSVALPPVPATTRVESADRMPALEGARLVVSGGRGMQGEAGFALLGRIAGQLGAALGGSLPTVDAGWVPVARQIGQSGKFVSPRIYLTVGISGTPQHLAGVSSDSRIIAINKDPAASIFAHAEVGVVAEWQALLPLLIEELDAAAA